MSLDSVPIWARRGDSARDGVHRSRIPAGRDLSSQLGRRKRSPISSISGAVLGLARFMLAFAFGLVADRYDARKALVRADANAIRTTYVRADFLPEAERTEARRLLGVYLDQRLLLFEVDNLDQQRAAPWFMEADRIQKRFGTWPSRTPEGT